MGKSSFYEMCLFVAVQMFVGLYILNDKKLENNTWITMT